jgi:hypothetical protein
VSRDQAVLIAKNAAKTFTYTSNGAQVTNLQVLDNPIAVEFNPHPKQVNSLTLYPYWFITLYLDKTYPGSVTELTVGVWADTGKIDNMQAK